MKGERESEDGRSEKGKAVGTERGESEEGGRVRMEGVRKGRR